MPYPDDFQTADLFPTSGQLAAEVHSGKVVRLSVALRRAADALGNFEFRVAGLCSPLDDLTDDDVEDAERVADTLEIALGAIAIGSARQ